MSIAIQKSLQVQFMQHFRSGVKLGIVFTLIIEAFAYGVWRILQ